MSWQGWLEFLNMGGYGLYVWGSYLVAPALALVEFVLLLLRRNGIRGHLGWRRDQLKRN